MQNKIYQEKVYHLWNNLCHCPLFSVGELHENNWEKHKNMVDCENNFKNFDIWASQKNVCVPGGALHLSLKILRGKMQCTLALSSLLCLDLFFSRILPESARLPLWFLIVLIKIVPKLYIGKFSYFLIYN